MQDDSDSESDDSDATETAELDLPASDLKNPVHPNSQSVSPLSSLHPSPSRPSSPILPTLPKSAQVQLERQNRSIAKVAQKFQEK